MPAEKTARVQERRRKSNRLVRSSTRTSVRRATLLLQQEPSESRAAVLNAISALDKAARKGVVHPHLAARKKSQLMRGLNQASS